MAIAGDFPWVFEVGPIFWAENSNTSRHLCEFIGIDLEVWLDFEFPTYKHILDFTIRLLSNSMWASEREEMTWIERIREYFGADRLYLEDNPTILSFNESAWILREINNHDTCFKSKLEHGLSKE